MRMPGSSPNKRLIDFPDLSSGEIFHGIDDHQHLEHAIGRLISPEFSHRSVSVCWNSSYNSMPR